MCVEDGGAVVTVEFLVGGAPLAGGCDLHDTFTRAETAAQLGMH